VKSLTIKPPTLISLFSGGGGLDLGLEAAGFETLLATDIDAHSCKTLRRGTQLAKAKKKPFLKSATVLEGDITQVTAAEIMRQANVRRGEVDLLAGGPPCQAFSVFGQRKGVDDPRGRLLEDYLRILSEMQPRAFMFENVFGLMTIGGGAVFRNLCKKLESPGNATRYTLSTFRLNAADYGVPQYRDRVFIIGSREGKTLSTIPPICAPSAQSSDLFLLRQRTVRDALRGLPPLGEKLSNHTSREHSKRIIERYRKLRPGERDSKTRINKLDLSKPSFTIIVGSDKGGGKGHVHPVEPREVSPRESARIQTFPDWWEFSGTSRHPIRQVGNAVPPLLAAMIGREMIATIFGRERRSLKKIVAKLDQQHLFEEAINGL
jgi:DNA (cytosine-5)-methyltransferase 1